MKLGLIAMSGLRVHNQELAELGLTLPGFIERKEVIASLPSLGLLTLASLTPADVDIEYIELSDFNADSNLPDEFDIVAISSFTAQINEAYLLADKYRQQGTKVILGGLHVTSLPHEALEHADSVLVGEGEVHWANVIDDFKRGQLKKIYDATGIEYDFSQAPIPRYDLLDVDQYNRLTVQTQRGCPFKCEFCASSIRLTCKYKIKPIQHVVNEIQAIKSIWHKPFIELADDNTFANKIHSKKLVKALSSLNIKWFTETDISVAENDELLSMLSNSGCRQLLIGLESPTAQGLHNLELKNNWKAKQLDKYKEAIQKIQNHGISVNGCFVLGLDNQDASVFDETLNFVKDSGLSEVQITIQTPFPGTNLYKRLKATNRLLEEVFWEKCTLFDVTYHPDKMTVGELETGFRELMKALYSDNLVRLRKEQFINQAKAARKTLNK
ncbi:radical SAM protein [Candidatus Albibeggiatoa sp. nov. NOAA]|uniref:B12-binding domain-containing radical SAM protein n=1 Tax=Candidatus Albibeggiatoa sp. nov. NOAA TaxID=3162724 RepID=UPI0032F852AB|nr:B12-binding domain-containing radical SAM protein [Thiotrichaceae bacterium]